MEDYLNLIEVYYKLNKLKINQENMTFLIYGGDVQKNRGRQIELKLRGKVTRKTT